MVKTVIIPNINDNEVHNVGKKFIKRTKYRENRIIAISYTRCK